MTQRSGDRSVPTVANSSSSHVGSEHKSNQPQLAKSSLMLTADVNLRRHAGELSTETGAGGDGGYPQPLPPQHDRGMYVRSTLSGAGVD